MSRTEWLAELAVAAAALAVTAIEYTVSRMRDVTTAQREHTS